VTWRALPDSSRPGGSKLAVFATFWQGSKKSDCLWNNAAGVDRKNYENLRVVIPGEFLKQREVQSLLPGI
jgi:hypothetical protein